MIQDCVFRQSDDLEIICVLDLGGNKRKRCLQSPSDGIDRGVHFRLRSVDRKHSKNTVIRCDAFHCIGHIGHWGPRKAIGRSLNVSIGTEGHKLKTCLEKDDTERRRHWSYHR